MNHQGAGRGVEHDVSALRDRLRWSQPKVVRRARHTWTEARVSIRRRSARWRADPAFLILGAQRCGTTSLYRYLSQHPSVVPPLVKEVQFFSSPVYLNGWSWYRAHFPLRSSLARDVAGGAAAVTFEATPYYLFHPLAPARVARSLPNARFIALLRNPVDRAFSHYLHSVQRGFEPLSFEDALAAEPSRLAGEAQRLVADERYDSHRYRAFSYFSRGIYVDQLTTWEQHVSRDRLLVLSSEALYTDPGAVLAQVLDWLGLEPWVPSSFAVFERSAPGRARLMANTRATLADEYRPHNTRLWDLLGRELSWTS